MLNLATRYPRESAEQIIGKNFEPFTEGLCTYLHRKFRPVHTFISLMYLFGRPEYTKWAKYFKTRFATVKKSEIGHLLKRDLKEIVKDIFRVLKGGKLIYK